MNRRQTVVFWIRRTPRSWKVAGLLNRLGWCWSDLVDYALAKDPAHPEWPSDEERLTWVGRKSTCARRAADPEVTSFGSCYCGQVGPYSPGRFRQLERRRRWMPRLRLAVAAIWVVSALLWAGILAPDSTTVPALQVVTPAGAVRTPPDPMPPTGRWALVTSSALRDGVLPLVEQGPAPAAVTP